jgi:hypothetical protein
MQRVPQKHQRRSFMHHDSALPVTESIKIEATNGAQVHVTIHVIKRDQNTDSLRWLADLLERRPALEATITKR